MGTLKVWDGSQWREVLPKLEDHGTLTGLADDDHTQYTLADGTRDFTGVVTGVDPTADQHLATKNYVENAATKTMTVSRLLDAEDITFFVTPVARTVEKLTPFINGATASGTTWHLRYATDRGAVGTEIITGGVNTHSGTGGNSGVAITLFDNATIPADNYVWLETTTASGIIDEFSLTLV